MINLKQELQNFRPIDIGALELKNISLSDNSRNSIILYNKAIDNLKMNSEDIAIIELKKALSLNPAFEEALHLLGICYCHVKDYSKAEEVFRRLKDLGTGSINVNRYLEAFSTGKTSVKLNDRNYTRVQETKKKDTKETGQKVFQSNEIRNILAGKTQFLKYVSVFISGVIVMLIVLLPFIMKPKAVQVVNNSVQEAKKPEVNVNKELEGKYNKLNEDFLKVSQELEASKKQVDYFKNVQKLFEVETLAAAREYEAAADKLVLLRTIEFKDAAKEKYDSLSKEIMPKAAWAVYTQGNNFYNTRKYQDAIAKLSKIQTYGTDWQYMAWTLYQLGICYKETNDVKNAVAVFQNIMQNYSNTEYAGYSEYRIKELGASDQ